MDIPAKPVSNVSASTATAGKRVVVNADREESPAQPEIGIEAPVRDLEQTLAVVAEQLNAFMRASSRDLEFSVDHGANTTVVTVRNASTGEVVRQIPNEDALRLMRRLNAQSGTLVDLIA